jgi:outer membrane receptor protein involved in Fe transport
MKHWFFLFFTFIFSHINIQAQDRVDSSYILDEVIVTATKNATNIAKLPYAVSVLNKQTIQRHSSRTVPEALFGTNGVFIQKTNHAGGSPFVRGLTGNQTLILVDGIRLNNSIFRYGPNQYLTLIDPFIVDKIDVVKGTGSVQYGTDAMTGVININTTALHFLDKPRWSENATFRYTEGGMERAIRPEFKYEGKKLAFMLGGSLKKFGDLRGGDTTGIQSPSGYDERSFDGKMMLDLGSQWNLNAAYQYLQQQSVPVYHKYKLENFAINKSDPISRGFAYVKLNKKFNASRIKQLDFFISNQALAESRFSQKNNSTTLRSEADRVNTFSGGADMLIEFMHFWTMNTGIELYADKIQSSRTDQNLSTGSVNNLRGLYPDASRFINTAAYALNHLSFGRLNIEAGLRYNIYKASIKDETLGSIELKPKALVFQGGLNYKLSEAFYVYTNLSEGFRSPNLDDLGTLGIVDFRYETPAYNLKPERSLNQELGIKYISRKVSADLSVFNTRLYDLITRIKTEQVISGYDVYKKVNIEKGFIRGWEAQMKFFPTSFLSFYAGATKLFGESITRDEPLRRIPPFNARIGIDIKKKQFVGGVVYNYASPQRRLAAGDKADNRIPSGGTPGFNLVDLYGGYDKELFSIKAYLNNIFNVDYRTHGSGINGMGRAIGMRISIRLSQIHPTTSVKD